jgi:uncharacterized protein YndB with AHSA1/START domain
MTNTQAIEVEREVRVSASPETIFPFLIDPEKIVRWKGTEAMLDPRPGGIYRVNVAGKNMARGEFVEVSPYSKVVFSWDETIVRLRHTDLPTKESAAKHTMGWNHYMSRLAVAAPGGDPGEDPMMNMDK